MKKEYKIFWLASLVCSRYLPLCHYQNDLRNLCLIQKLLCAEGIKTCAESEERGASRKHSELEAAFSSNKEFYDMLARWVTLVIIHFKVPHLKGELKLRTWIYCKANSLKAMTFLSLQHLGCIASYEEFLSSLQTAFTCLLCIPQSRYVCTLLPQTIGPVRAQRLKKKCLCSLMQAPENSEGFALIPVLKIHNPDLLTSTTQQKIHMQEQYCCFLAEHRCTEKEPM